MKLRDGSMWRGTIVELVAGSHVVLVAFGGEAKRFAAADVSYAGPADSAAQQPVPAASSAAPGAAAPVVQPRPPGTVRLTLKPPGNLSFYAQTKGRGFTRLCSGACEKDVAPGSYLLALGSDTRKPAAAPKRTQVEVDQEIAAEFGSRRGARIAGGVIWTVGTISGLGILVSGMKARNETSGVCDDLSYDCEEDKAGRPAIALGAVTALLSTLIGVILISRKDQVFLHANAVQPAAPPAAPSQVEVEPAPAPEPALAPAAPAAPAPSEAGTVPALP